jgi:ABC-type oligopeptide transport system substrate-binding subunit
MEHNPYYWRRNLPKAENLVFHLGLSPEQIVGEFEAGRLSLASDLLPDDVDLLRRRKPPPYYREHPRLSTYFLVLDNRDGPFAERELRRALARAVDLGSIQASTLGARVSRAHGLLPPGLLGYDGRRRAPEVDRAAGERLRGLRLAVRPISAYLGALAPFWARWCDEIRRLGVELTNEDLMIDRATIEAGSDAGCDVVAFRWIADYPDADAFTLALDFCAARGWFDPTPFPELTRLARQGRHETDPALRHALYRELEDVLARECLIVPLFHEQAYRLAQPEVHGLRLGLGFPEVCYEELYLES